MMSSATAPLRARIRVYSWGFFLRVATESDLGLARSFIAGEWGADDLTAVFSVFIANRDGAAALSTHGLWTAWVGLTLNFLTFTLSMDNSVANSRSNIHAHYDLSNDLFTAFLDPGTMMYSCGFFETSRRVLKEVDLHWCVRARAATVWPRFSAKHSASSLTLSLSLSLSHTHTHTRAHNTPPTPTHTTPPISPFLQCHLYHLYHFSSHTSTNLCLSLELHPSRGPGRCLCFWQGARGNSIWGHFGGGTAEEIRPPHSPCPSSTRVSV